MRKRFYAGGLHFGCTECGNCCSNPDGLVNISEQEGIALAELLQISEEDFLWEYSEIHQDRLFLRSHDNGDCIFLRGKRCSVYAARPTQCRSFPFWPENLKSQYRWGKVAGQCPGIGEGRVYSAAEIERIAGHMQHYESGDPESG